MNSYGDLTALKSASYLDISVTTHDTYLRKLLEQSSRMVDKWCGRAFYVYSGTWYFDGVGTKLFLPVDLLSITTLKTDEDGDGTFENSLAVTDYFLYPLNDYPKIKAEINPNGNYGGFASGIQKGIEIVGVFGYGDGISASPYSSGGTLGAAIADVTTTSVTMTAGHTVAAGHTILIDSEQIYVQVVLVNALTVRRGVNGTTAATHTIGATVYIYEYPMPVIQACLITAMRAFKRKDSAYQDIVGGMEVGTLIVSKGIDPDVMETIKMYRKWRYV